MWLGAKDNRVYYKLKFLKSKNTIIIKRLLKYLILFIYVSLIKKAICYYNTLYIKTLKNLIILSIKNKLEKPSSST